MSGSSTDRTLPGVHQPFPRTHPSGTIPDANAMPAIREMAPDATATTDARVNISLSSLSSLRGGG